MTDFDDLADRADELRSEAKVTHTPAEVPNHRWFIFDLHDNQVGDDKGYSTKENATNAALVLRREVQVPLQTKLVAC